MTTRDYTKYGIDYDGGVQSFFHDDSLFRLMLSIFLGDDTFRRTLDSYEAGNWDELSRTAHELKDRSGNIFLTRLYQASSALAEYLRAGGRDRADIDRLFIAVYAAYELAREGAAKMLMRAGKGE